MLNGDPRPLPLTRACHCEWKLSIAWDPDPLPGYVPTKPDQNPPNHSDVCPADAALRRMMRMAGMTGMMHMIGMMAMMRFLCCSGGGASGVESIQQAQRGLKKRRGVKQTR